MRNPFNYIRRKQAKLKVKLFPNSPMGQWAQALRQWKKDKEKIQEETYNFGPSSLLIDVGGYEGQWASDMYGRYRSHIVIFEPVARFADNIKKRFAKNPDITVYPYGLGNKTGDMEISVDADSSSIFARKGRPTETIPMVAAASFFKEHNINEIDLIKMNIEGSEYGLLEHMIETGIMKKVRNLHVQFHYFVPDAEARMKKIQAGLLKTHRPTHQYPFVWEYWVRND